MKVIDILTWCNEQSPQCEFSRRNFTSRYYYWLFHTIRESFPEMPKYANIGVHKSVSEYLERGCADTRFDKKELRILSYLLVAAKNHRVTADYELDQDFTETDRLDAKLSIENCASQLVKIFTQIPQIGSSTQ